MTLSGNRVAEDVIVDLKSKLSWLPSVWSNSNGKCP